MSTSFTPATQPDLAQYPIHPTLDTVATYADRAAYLAATGQQAPPFNPDPTKPIKTYIGSGTVLVFDSVSGQFISINIPTTNDSVNLPGAYNFPVAVWPPTDAKEYGPFGLIGPVSADVLCLQADAQEVANEIAFLYPGKKISVVQEQTSVVYIVWGTDPRRQWLIQIGSMSILAQALIEAKAIAGVGAPGHWVLNTATGGPAWMVDPQVTTAPANAPVAPVPVRALLANEKIGQVTVGSGPFAETVWMVLRTDLGLAVTLAQVQALVASYNEQSGVAPIQVVAAGV